jgi:hypothetical protein
MTSAFFQGQAIGAFADGFSKSLPPAVVELLSKLTGVNLPDGVTTHDEQAAAAKADGKGEPEREPAKRRETEQELRV